MRLACVFVPRFPLAVERLAARGGARAGAAGAGQPAIVYSRTQVVEASPELPEAWPGRSLRHVRALYPDALYIPEDAARYREAAAAMLRALECVAPEVEPAGLGCAYLDLRGLERHYAGADDLARTIVRAVREETGLLASVGIASGKFPARIAALLADPGAANVVRTGQERRFLRDVSAGLLPFDPEIAQRLHALAIHTLGDVAGLPRTAVEAQFRGIGGRMWDLANGIDGDPLVPRRTAEAITERLSFESPVVTSEALIMAARQVVRRLSMRLERRAARKMHAQVLAEGRLVWERLETFRDATSDEVRMMTLLKTRLSALQLTEAVDTIAVTLSEITREPARQSKLITETNPQLERLLESVHEIRARFGGPMVWRAVEVDPCSRHPEDRTILIPYDA